MTNDNATPSKFNSPFKFESPSKSKHNSKHNKNNNPSPPLNNDLSLLVDIMYYDFILFKMVEVYRNNDQILLDEYYQIVKILFKKFKSNDITLDLQTSLKILYIQIKKIIKENNCYKKNKGGDCKDKNEKGKDKKGDLNPGSPSKNNPQNNHNHNPSPLVDPLCCSDHLSLILEKIFYFLCDIKDDHKILLEEKIYKDFVFLISSLIIIYYTETNNTKKDLIKLTSKHINLNNDGYNRLKLGMYLKLGVRQEREFEDKMLKAIDNILEKTFSLLNEPYLYSLTVEKVKGMFNKHSMIFKEEKEMIFKKGDKVKDIINPKTPGEKVKWDYRSL
ncbi:hypothetical protein NBO_1271g0001 [Nosema bombycis CQ1]|uniref:Uncharacterized protein n=1 Tax=Nosema bombycis (strain CQ1 / CVCC 102059) TaxID=578461 RepID=R0MF16_NOSB1|nr:hypothetical protein NBO_1271g0001 [Nosema bombycis CQ1]|eukprot:EOB11343.1 hypothetical protein NBO_1271g0001 [Nosema bombycis CQ1]